MKELNPDTLVAAVTGAMFFMLKQRDASWTERIAFLVVGTISAYVCSNAIVLYFALDAGLTGAIGFFAGVIAIPIAEFFMVAAKDPLGFYRRIMRIKDDAEKKDGGENG